MKKQILVCLASLGLVLGGSAWADPFMNSLAVGAQAPAFIRAGGTATYGLTITKTNSGNLEAYLSCAGLPAGATASFSPSPVVFSGGASTATATLTVATTTAVGNGTYTFSVTARDGGSPHTITNTGTLTEGNTAAVAFIPSITSLAPLPDGTLQVQARGGVGQTYVVQGSFSLVPATWVNLSTNLADASGTFAFTDLDAKNYSSRFYRLMTQP